MDAPRVALTKEVGQPRLHRHGERAAVHRRAGRRPAQERIPRDAGARAAQSAGADPQRRAHHAQRRRDASTMELGARCHRPPGRSHGAPDRRPAGRLAHRAGQGGREAGAAQLGDARSNARSKPVRRARAGREQMLRSSCRKSTVELNGDPVRLAQVLSNLINNASKFSPAGSRITVSASFAQRRGEDCR